MLPKFYQAIATNFTQNCRRSQLYKICLLTDAKCQMPRFYTWAILRKFNFCATGLLGDRNT